MPIPDLIPNWKVAENTCILKDKHTVEIGSQINFLGVALWLKLSEAENQGIERFMQTLLKQRSSKLGADNEICECIIFKIFFSGKSDTGAETSTIAAEGIVRQWIFKQKTLCNVSMWEKKKKVEEKLLLHLFRCLYCLRWIFSENHMPMLIVTIVAVLSKKERTDLVQIIEGEKILS